VPSGWYLVLFTIRFNYSLPNSFILTVSFIDVAYYILWDFERHTWIVDFQFKSYIFSSWKQTFHDKIQFYGKEWSHSAQTLCSITEKSISLIFSKRQKNWVQYLWFITNAWNSICFHCIHIFTEIILWCMQQPWNLWTM